MNRIARSLASASLIAIALVVGLPGSAMAEPVATASETTDLVDGQSVTVDYTGFPADATIAVVQCTAAPPESNDECDEAGFELGVADADGAGTVTFTVHTGVIGADGSTCDGADNNTCGIVVTDFPLTVSAAIPISFAAGDEPGDEAAPPSTEGDDPASDDPADDATTEDASSDDDDGSATGWLIGGGVALLAVVIAAVVLVRRRQS